jgi:cyclohexa-1,5-dienecarbonyl-CoA hydratase
MESKQDQFITFEIQEGVAHLTLNRPPVNVLHIPMLHQLDTALEALSRNTDVRVLILQAEGKMFSAGVDVADHTADKVDEMIPLFNRVCVSLVEFPVPTIAVVHGHALGGGCELVLCCDFAVMSEDAKLGQPEIQLAAIAPIAAVRLSQFVGHRVAADLLFTGRTLTAIDAREFGLVNAVLPADEVAKWAHEKAAQIAGLSRAAQILNKRAMLLGMDDGWNALPELERLYLQDLMNTKDANEGISAFIEKRQPEWKHE